MTVNEMEALTQTRSRSGSDPELQGSQPAMVEISLLDLLIIIVRGRRVIALITGCVTLIGLIVALVLPVRYTATTSILPPQQSSVVGSGLISQFGSLGALAGSSLGLKNPSELQVSLLKSRTVEDAMLDRFHLLDLYHTKFRSAARKSFENAVDIEDAAKDGLIHISITDRNPQRAADIANGYVDEFRKFSATLAVTEASQRRLFFEQQLEQAKADLTKAEEDLSLTEQKTGVLQLDAQARSAIAFAADLRAQIAAKQVEINAMRSYATGDNPQLQIAQQQLAGLEAQETKLASDSTNSANAFQSKGSLQASSIGYIQKVRNVRYYETIFDLMARQYEIAKVDEAREGAVIQVVDRAVVPDHHSSPKRTLIVLGAIVLGFILSVCLVLVMKKMEDPEAAGQVSALKQAWAQDRR